MKGPSAAAPRRRSQEGRSDVRLYHDDIKIPLAKLPKVYTVLC